MAISNFSFFDSVFGLIAPGASLSLSHTDEPIDGPCSLSFSPSPSRLSLMRIAAAAIAADGVHFKMTLSLFCSTSLNTCLFSMRCVCLYS